MKEKRSSRYSKFIVALVICMNAGFTLAVLYIFRRVGSEPTALIAAWFSFTTTELWMLASIKKVKTKHLANEASTIINQINQNGPGMGK